MNECRCFIHKIAAEEGDHERENSIFKPRKYFIKTHDLCRMTQKITAAITAVGGYVPEDILSNADLEKMVDTNDEWIRTRTGISERRILKGLDKGTSDLCVPAVLKLCEKRGIFPQKLIALSSVPLLPTCFSLQPQTWFAKKPEP